MSPESKLKWLAVVGCVLIGTSLWLWPSPERALLNKLAELETAMNESPSAFAKAAAAGLSNPTKIRVQGHFEEEMSPEDAAARWQQFAQLFGPVVVEMEQLEASLDPPEVKGKVLVSSQPRDLHARAHAFVAHFKSVGSEWQLDAVTLFQAPQHLPEARP